MMDEMLLVERMKTIDQLMNAAHCVTNLRNAIPTCVNDVELSRVEVGVRFYEGEMQRLGERVLSLEAAPQATTWTL